MKKHLLLAVLLLWGAVPLAFRLQAQSVEQAAAEYRNFVNLNNSNADKGSLYSALYRCYKAYLAVPKVNANGIKYLSLEKPTGIQQTINNKRKLVNVYSISGTLIRKQVQERGALDGLPAGIYLINGKKVLK